MYSTGFLRNKVKLIVNRDNFLNHHTHIYLAREDRQIVQAYDVDLDYRIQIITSTMGEFFEREVLINTNRIKAKTLISRSMIDGRLTKVPTERIVSQDVFVDSCGMASHIISEELIKTSFLEFLERQSFILNYLSQSKGIKLDIAEIEILKRYDSYIKNFVDNVTYYNISIDDNINIILSVAIGEDKKALGLGTHSSLKEAVLKSQKEVLQNFAVACSKYNKDMGFNNEVNSKKDWYHKNFENLSPKEVKEFYSYLEESPVHRIPRNVANNGFNMTSLIKRIYLKYGIEPFIVVISAKRDIPNLKIAKIIDFNWFPHMNPQFYTDDIYKYVEKKTGLFLHKNIKAIPFP